jgi:mono/diheme cytochrome c family protein
MCLCACNILPPSGASAADAENGQRLAERWCTSCHAVSAAQKSASADVPPFSGIAGRPDFSAAALALFLLHPHPKMPDMGLSREAAADLAAYIEKQRQ